MIRQLLLAALALFCVATLPASANLLVNPGFEQPIVTNPDQFQYYYAGDPSITGWVITGNSVDVLKSTRWTPHEGNQSVDLTGVTAGGLYQDVATTVGQLYRLSFWIAGNPEFPNAGGGPFIKQAKLSWGAAAVTTLSFDVTGKTDLNPGWVKYSFDLTATGPTTRLQFQSLTSGFSGVMLDDLNLIQVPPPGPPAGVPLPAAALTGVACASLAGMIRRRFA